MKRKESNFFQELLDRFMKVYNSIPAQLKPPIGLAQLQYTEYFDGEFSLWLSERRSTSFVSMMKKTIEVDMKLVVARKKKRDEWEWRR